MPHPVDPAAFTDCPNCGGKMLKRRSASAWCAQCADSDGNFPGWPRRAEDGLGLPVTCPHCVGGPAESGCCVCKGTRQVSCLELPKLMHSIWARADCICHTCRRLGPAPSGLEDVTRAEHLGRRVVKRQSA